MRYMIAGTDGIAREVPYNQWRQPWRAMPWSERVLHLNHLSHNLPLTAWAWTRRGAGVTVQIIRAALRLR